MQLIDYSLKDAETPILQYTRLQTKFYSFSYSRKGDVKKSRIVLSVMLTCMSMSNKRIDNVSPTPSCDVKSHKERISSQLLSHDKRILAIR